MALIILKQVLYLVVVEFQQFIMEMRLNIIVLLGVMIIQMIFTLK